VRGGGEEWAGGPIPPPCGHLTRCFFAIAEFLVPIRYSDKLTLFLGPFSPWAVLDITMGLFGLFNGPFWSGPFWFTGRFGIDPQEA